MPDGWHSGIFNGSSVNAGNLSRAYCSRNESADAGSAFVPGDDGRTAEAALNDFRTSPQNGEGKASDSGNSADWKGLYAGRGFRLV